MRLFCDRMLGTLARWLRFMGHDVVYPREEMDDNDIRETCMRESRRLVTRDRDLALHVPGSILITSTDLREQVIQAVAEAGIVDEDVLTRCGVCNTPLEGVVKESVAGLVPESVYRRHGGFMRCPRCQRLYWKGSHYDRILASIERVRHR